MTDDFEQKLRKTLDERAGDPQPGLDGPGLRRLAGERTRPAARLRRSAPVLATAAAVAAIGIVAAISTRPDPAPPVQPGGVPPVATSTPPGTPPSPLPGPPSSTPRRAGTVSPTLAPQTPVRSPTGPSQPLVSSPFGSATPTRPAVRSEPGRPRVSSTAVPSTSRTRTDERGRPAGIVISP